MKFISTFLLLVAVMVGVESCKRPPPKLPAIFRIGHTSDNRPSCSAFAIDDTHALTAKHCVVPILNTPFGQMLLDIPLPMSVYDEKGAVLQSNLDSKFSRVPDLDMAVITGNFKNYEHLKLDNHILQLSHRDDFMSCGYPFMTPRLLCSHLYPFEPDLFRYRARGYLIFGMSGGPVFNMSKGVVIGINSAIGEGIVVFTPLVALDVLLGVN